MKIFGRRLVEDLIQVELQVLGINKTIKKTENLTLIATGSTGKMVDKEKRKEECKDIGLNFSHQYSLINSFILPKDKFGLENDCRLLKIKNPKKQAWAGNWSEKSALWTDQIKEYVGFDPEDEGTFYITFEDYGKYFYKLTLGFYDPKMKFKFLNLSHKIGDASLIRFQVFQESKIHFKVVQMSRCLLPRSFKYKVARVHFVIGRLKDKASYVGSYSANSSEGFGIKPKEKFKPGVYLIRIELDWNHDNITEYGLNFLSDKEIDVFEDYETDHGQFLKQCMISYAKKHVKKYRTPKGIKSMIIKHENGGNSGGYGFHYYENNSKKNKILYEKIKFTKHQGIKFLYDQPLDDFYTVQVPAGSCAILLTKKISMISKIKFTHVTKSLS